MQSTDPISLAAPRSARAKIRTAGKLPIRARAEYWAARGVLGLLQVLPHRAARRICTGLAVLSYAFWPRLRGVGLANLRIAYPEFSERERKRILLASFENLGRMLADFSHFPRWNRDNINRVITYDGYENFLRAARQHKGLIFLTAHFGAWELGSFAHGLHGHPVNFVVRPLDNPLIDLLIDRYRCSSGGRSIDKRDFARQALTCLRQGESVGILIDQNMLLTEGVFVDFFGRPACTTTGPARIARKTQAPVVLGLVIWDAAAKRYRLRFDQVDWICHDDPDEEIRLNTARYTALLEQYIRRYPDQWLWVHRRWKTQPPGER